MKDDDAREVVWRGTGAASWFIVVSLGRKGFVVVDEPHEYDVTEPIRELGKAMHKADELNAGRLMGLAQRPR